MIISDTTIRKIIVDDKDKCLEIVKQGIEEFLVDVNKHDNIYEINLVHKVGDYYKEKKETSNESIIGLNRFNRR